MIDVTVLLARLCGLTAVTYEDVNGYWFDFLTKQELTEYQRLEAEERREYSVKSCVCGGTPLIDRTEEDEGKITIKCLNCGRSVTEHGDVGVLLGSEDPLGQ